MKKPMFIMLIIVGTIFGLIFSYQAFKSYMIKKALSGNFIPTSTVSTMKVQSLPWQPKIKASGSLRAVRGVDVTTQLAGMVSQILFTPGTSVKQGTLLVKLNDDVEVAQLQSLEASLTLARITYDRNKGLLAANAASQQTLDNNTGNLKSLMAQVAEQKAVVAKKNIRAPFSGRLGICYINPGQYLNPGDKIVSLQTMDPIYVDFFVPQQHLVQLKQGQTVTLTSDTFPGITFTGKITTIDPKVDPATRNIAVEATICNPKHALFPGMFAAVEVGTGKPVRYLTVPQTAISFNPYGEIVYIVKEKGKDKNGKPNLIATQSFVTVGESRGDQITVLKGLKEGDIVVTSGQLKLKNGSPVSINNSIKVGNNPAPKIVDE